MQCLWPGEGRLGQDSSCLSGHAVGEKRLLAVLSSSWAEKSHLESENLFP